MTIRKNTDYFRILLYLLFTAAMLFLEYTLDNREPFSLALAYALALSGLSPYVVSFFFFAVSIVRPTFVNILLHGGQALLLMLGFFVRSRLKKRKNPLPPLLALSLGLGLYVGFAPFSPYTLISALSPVLQKTCVCAFAFLLSAVFTVATNALLKKLLKCRLLGEEIVFCALLFVATGIGICNFWSLNAYTGIAFFILLTFTFVVKDASALVCAFVLSLPPALTASLPLDRFFVYGTAVALFVRAGRLSATLALLCAFFAYGYFDGLYTYATPLLVQSVLAAVLPALLFILLPSPLVREMENKLIFYREKHLSRIAINRNRSAIGEQLFEISAVFREIQTTFAALGSNEAEAGAREYIRSCVTEEACKNCPQYRSCQRKGLAEELDKLIAVGCLKGKTSLIDLPRALAETCINQSNVLYAVNRQLSDYRKYMTETENAANGRALLANQAQGISAILKNLAIEQSEPLKMYTDKERALNAALQKAGVVCSEVLIYGDADDPTLSLITYGIADVKKIAAIASEQFHETMIISQRLTLSNDKFCCILRKKPQFDAVFGVASMKKTGEIASGDTHSVIRIDERRFMVALSDGMGSGEYARRISESTISLLESFYRAKMPSETVLSTINKLITFTNEETFACVDIAIVDLDDGKADIIKIGSPVGFILSGNTVKVLETATLPLGILDTLHPDASSYDLKENDVLLFLSDGVTDAFGSTTDLYEVLKTLPARNPQQLVDTLLERTLAAYGGIAKDDATAVAVRLFRSPQI
ncbi:MAG: SpoIIE family protein phosphatase [Clostridia bacterium]|nr:SpoIIE family protein phosphatase [Clostridia bacterium]